MFANQTRWKYQCLRTKPDRNSIACEPNQIEIAMFANQTGLKYQCLPIKPDRNIMQCLRVKPDKKYQCLRTKPDKNIKACEPN